MSLISSSNSNKMDFCVKCTIFVVLVATICCPSVQSKDRFEDDLTVTIKQKEIIDRFRDLMGSRLIHDYMKKEIYLVRWLRARKFNIPAAEEMLMKSLRWRKENNMDNILKEDWSDFGRDYRADIQGCDLEGRPVISIPVGDWDVRNAVLSGKSDRMMRYFDKLFEELTTNIRISQEKGENMTQYDLIFEMSHFNLALQGCAACIPVYVHFFQTYENNYPGSGHKTVMLNVPQIFLPLWQIIRPFLSERTRNIISLYGRDKNEWRPVLLSYIHKSQLTKEFGGEREDPFDIDQLRVEGGHFKCAAYASS